MNRSIALGAPLLGRVLSRFTVATIIRVGTAVLIALVPFLAYAINVLHSFYDVGSSFFDAGWSAFLIHDGDLQLHEPPCIVYGSSWFDFHISPLFIATSAFGHLLPLTRIQFYATYVGISHALPAVAVFWLLVSGYRMTGPIERAVAALLALSFAFDGLAVAIARFPHFTMFIVGTGMMFLVALVLRRFRIALFFFLLCLATREDAGFHLFALLSLLTLLECWRGTRLREQKSTVLFALGAFCYSTAVVGLQHVLAGPNPLLISEYLGSPPFADVTLASMAQRFIGWMVYRGYVVLPAVGALAWAVARRNPYVILGYVAFLPWGLLHLAAAREMLGILPSYYAFPFMLASFWPLVGLLVERRHFDAARSILEPLSGFALLTAATFIGSPLPHNPANVDLPAGFASPPSFSRQAATDRSLARLAVMPELGRVLVDQSVLALVPELYRAGDMLSGDLPGDPDTIIYFASGFESGLARQVAVRAGLDRRYEVPGTQIRLATNRPIGGSSGLTALPP